MRLSGAPPCSMIPAHTPQHHTPPGLRLPHPVHQTSPNPPGSYNALSLTRISQTLFLWICCYSMVLNKSMHIFKIAIILASLLIIILHQKSIHLMINGKISVILNSVPFIKASAFLRWTRLLPRPTFSLSLYLGQHLPNPYYSKISSHSVLNYDRLNVNRV